jgi:hypothetical protein
MVRHWCRKLATSFLTSLGLVLVCRFLPKSLCTKLRESSSDAIFVFLTEDSGEVFIKAHSERQERWEMCKSAA